MIRVLNIINLGLGGAETTVMSYYRNIDRSKIQFDFLVDDGAAYYYESEAVALGANIYRKPMRTRHPIRSTTLFRKILREDPDIKIVHIHTSWAKSAIDSLLAKLFGVRVRIAHSRSALANPLVLHRFLQGLLRATATHWIGCSTEAGISLFGEKAKNCEKLIIFPNARDLEPFRFDPEKRDALRQELGLERRFVLISVGRLVPEKNYGFLLDLFACTLKKLPGLVLMIAGDGAIRGELETKAAALGVGDHVRFLGRRDDIPALLQAADLFVLPSLHEGLPGSAVEAQAAGLPCLISDKVTRECKATEAVEFLPIDKGPEIWAERILSYRAYARRDTIEDVRSAGFGIRDAAKKLEEFYLEAVRQSAAL